MKRTIFCVALILCMAIMAGCAAQASGKTQTPISAKTELTSAQEADDTAEVVTALLPSQTVEENSKAEDSADALLPAVRIQPMRSAVRADGMVARVAEKHLQRVPCRRITVKNAANIFSHGSKHRFVSNYKKYASVLFP